MKKVLPSIALLAIVMLLSDACSKKNDDGYECQTCKAFNTDGQEVDEETVCSETAESTFRAQNEGRSIQCD